MDAGDHAPPCQAVLPPRIAATRAMPMCRPMISGHARVYVAFDVIYRFLRHLGYDVSAACI